MLRFYQFGATLALFSLSLHAKTLYVASTGNDTASGTLTAPLGSMTKAQSSATAGDTVYFRGGIYYFKSTTDSIGVSLNKSGVQGNPIHYLAYPGENPVFDFYQLTAPQRIKGIQVTANWIHLKGFEIRGVPQSDALKAHEDWGIYVNGGGNDIFELLNLHHNMGPGMFIIAGGNNLILNCDSHDNYDAYSYTNGTLDAGQNADGFGFHSRNTADTGTVFRGCRAWWNADDGWDFINAAASVKVENCWSWNNGYKAGTTSAAGNGNGFKVGGYGMPPANYPATLPQHRIQFCLAFDNRSAGFYQNHHPIANYYYNNSSFNNKTANFNLLGVKLSDSSDISLGILRNNLAFTGTTLANATTGSGVDAAYNSWNIGSPASGDFQSTDSLGVSGPRQSDGSLPNIKFMRLTANSSWIDKGKDVNLPFVGTAPDLGAFEYGMTTQVNPACKNKAANRVLRLGQMPFYPKIDMSGRRINNRP